MPPCTSSHLSCIESRYVQHLAHRVGLPTRYTHQLPQRSRVCFPPKTPASHKKGRSKRWSVPLPCTAIDWGSWEQRWQTSPRPPYPCPLSPLHVSTTCCRLAPPPQHTTNTSQAPHCLNTGGRPLLNSTCTRHPGSHLQTLDTLYTTARNPGCQAPAQSPTGPHLPTHTSLQKAAQSIVATSPAATTQVSGGPAFTQQHWVRLYHLSKQQPASGWPAGSVKQPAQPTLPCAGHGCQHTRSHTPSLSHTGPAEFF